MTKKLLLLLPLLTGLPLFATGALRRPPVAPVASFVAEPVSLAPELAVAGAGARGIFDRALERLAPDRLAWLKVKLWQRMADATTAFEAEGTLLIGPKDCARLDLSVRTGGIPGHWLVVSDGRALAHMVQLGSEDPTVICQLLTPTPDPEAPPPPLPADVLRDLGCGGPYPLLKDLRTRLRNLAVQTGRLQGRPVVRLQGRLDPAQAPPAAGTAVRADFCYLYLDAQMLWPARLEWWLGDPTHGARLILEMEFRDPQLNRPLSVSECIRAFTYRPKGT